MLVIIVTSDCIELSPTTTTLTQGNKDFDVTMHWAVYPCYQYLLNKWLCEYSRTGIMTELARLRNAGLTAVNRFGSIEPSTHVNKALAPPTYCLLMSS